MTNINFLNDLQEDITQELAWCGYNLPLEDNIDTVVRKYFNFLQKIPPVCLWTVKQSKELTSKSLSPQLRLGLHQFINKAKSGQSLKPYLSKHSDNPEYKDLMFYDWGIFHFHLGIEPDLKDLRFVKRTDDLLFAIADYDRATMYLIDIHRHLGGFTNQDLLRIIEDNWPKILDPYTLRLIGLTYNASDSDIGSLRKAGINTLLQTPSGRVLTSMGGGITSAGTSISIKREADSRIVEVCQLQEWFISQQETVAPYFKSKYGKNWNELKFKIKLFEVPVRIEEMTTNEVVFLIHS